ncbi:MAG: lipoyl(octanoyl) transferase LipB [Bacteroidia bacterium]|nr:lipoyl(octanoyl) transferase LipB [Bacteroidia bacterium]
MEYERAWDIQEELLSELTERKMRNRSVPEQEKEPVHHYLLFCEHPHVYTLGRSGDESHLLAGMLQLKNLSATFVKNNRGGDITYHGPGQLVGYPILDLDHFFTDIHKYLRMLEESVIWTLRRYGIEGSRYPGYTGVWLDPEDPRQARKICAIGVRCSRWVTMHGFALNVNTDLSYFDHIVPCGITGKKVTSMEKELGKKIDLNEVEMKLRDDIGTLFGMKFF